VAHGPALDALEDVAAVDNVREAVAALQKDGVRFEMCTNTLTANKLNLEDLLPGFALADQGGVVRIAELQQQGYLYIRP
ncbi:MAG: DsrE family protein, partial [Gammaproteobacteria bacterium]